MSSFCKTIVKVSIGTILTMISYAIFPKTFYVGFLTGTFIMFTFAILDVLMEAD